MKLVLVFFLGVGVAKADVKSWWKDFCERHIVANDPEQHAWMPTAKLVKVYREIGAELYWRKSEEKALLLKELGEEMRKRLYDPAEPDEMIEAIDDALFDYQSQEVSK